MNDPGKDWIVVMMVNGKWLRCPGEYRKRAAEKRRDHMTKVFPARLYRARKVK